MEMETVGVRENDESLATFNLTVGIMQHVEKQLFRRLEKDQKL